jgi:DNA polymerase
MSQEFRDLVADVREQVAFLQELGVETLDARLPEVDVTQIAAVAQPAKELPRRELPPEKIEISQPPPQYQRRSAGERLASLPSLKKRATASVSSETTSLPTNEMTETLSASAPATGETIFGDISGLPDSTETMEQVWADIGNCTRCPLHEGRTQIVQTVGNYESDLMFIGEAPGADEDAKGEPFVGRAGQLLNKIIEAIGMKREEVCIGNINRCRPPGNRQPTLPEAHTCKPFLLREIAVIRPKVIVVMGNTALHNLLDTKVGITRMRGQFHDYYGVKVMPTFHPAYLLRDPSKKREVWDDMKKVRDYLTSLESEISAA